MTNKVRFDVDPVRSKSRLMSDREHRVVADLEEHCAACSICHAHLYDYPRKAMCLHGRAQWHSLAGLFDRRDGRFVQKRKSRGSIEYVEVPSRYRYTRRLLYLETAWSDASYLQGRGRHGVGIAMDGSKLTPSAHSQPCTYSISIYSSHYHHSSDRSRSLWYTKELVYRSRH
jgi:hypothetical protein